MSFSRFPKAKKNSINLIFLFLHFYFEVPFCHQTSYSSSKKSSDLLRYIRVFSFLLFYFTATSYIQNSERCTTRYFLGVVLYVIAVSFYHVRHTVWNWLSFNEQKKKLKEFFSYVQSSNFLSSFIYIWISFDKNKYSQPIDWIELAEDFTIK